MAPSAIEAETPSTISNGNAPSKGSRLLRAPLKASGLLDQHHFFESTTIIGREYPDVQIADLMRSPQRDQYIRDLAITVSQRCVVFFRKQDGMTPELQKELALLLGSLTGRPATNGLHIHPLVEGKMEVDFIDRNVNVISSHISQKLQGEEYGDRYRFSSGGWHSDMGWEERPSDYAVLKMNETPHSGGDTLWASGYEVYDRLSARMQRFLDGLTAVHDNPQFIAQAQRVGFKIHPGPRGAPENVGTHLTATHPLIRTNPVTGWKSVFSSFGGTPRINELTPQESDQMLKYLAKMCHQNHDLQVRFKWGVNDIAIWDNRCAYHTATKDLDGSGPRTGRRTAGIGEEPYLDPASTSRREALAAKEISGWR
ncbi:hypothetical protein H2200_000509 [Cladophialophora chaetospira]|uniref:TauD/TfdA-like domain-containing protein n=1 Tax=Cladophialophora chaetospira TaxID=386627 RepID=A0AA38XNK3_9EURO|nr:hypothetical protein H2200_000509 [Cladophialophora chaetospira]